MTRGASGGVLALVAVLAALSGCAPGSAEEAGAAAGRGSAQTTATVRPAPTGPTAGDGFVAADAVSLADGVTLVPGRDGRLPVRIRWVKEMAAAEGLAVDGDRLLVLDEAAEALRLADGVEVWRSGDPSQNGLEADGSIVIGVDRKGHVRMWSPFNFDLTVDRATGRFVSLHPVGGSDLPADIRPFASPAPAYSLGPDPARTLVVDRTGQVAFEIRVREPWFETVGPVSVPGGMALVTSSGHLVVLDYA